LANSGLEMANSWYVATANPAPRYAALAGDITADLAIVGGGATGLSAALHAAERGLSVVLLEGGRIGWGASGRNGGQIIPGLRQGAADLIAALGRERGTALVQLALEARDLVVGLIARHGINCDLRLTGHLLGAVKPGQIRDYETEVRVLEDVIGYRHARLLSRSEAANAVATPYLGAFFDAGGGHFHTLNYTLGLAAAAAKAGSQLFENTLVTDLQRTVTGVILRAAAGTIRATNVVLAGDALLEGLSPRVNHRIMPVANYIITSAPLPDAASLIASDAAVSDARFVVNYFRRTPDNRLMFGGGERYTRRPPADINAFARPFLERIFPQLRGVQLDHGWGGLVSVTRSRLPDIGRDGPILWAHGYSGQGAILSTLGGLLLAEAVIGETTRFDRFVAVAPRAFPGGAALRGPLHVMGMLWYAMRDRLG
jgi:gamma-glutamylputrescine oxidase